MACGKPPDPDQMTPPEDLRHPRQGAGGEPLHAITGHEIASIDSPLRPVSESAENFTAARVAPAVCEALTNPKHWMHEQTTTRLIDCVNGNQQISHDYRSQLSKDIAEVLRITPHALGLAERAIHRGQDQPLMSESKIGQGTGYVYELMGTAALIREASPPANKGGVPLCIIPGEDRVHHGIKLQASYRDDRRELYQQRKTVEADIWIQKPGHRDVAVDFKHAKDGTSYSDKGGKKATQAGTSELATQLAGVVNALRTGEIHEFHFATNGHFSKGFRDAVAAANEKLSGTGCVPISIHNHVIASHLRVQ